MDVKELKEKIENNTVGNGLIIFVYEDNDFIPNQYLKTISLNKKLNIRVVEEPSELLSKPVLDIFGLQESSNDILLYKSNSFDFNDEKLTKEVNRIVITNKISDACKKTYKDYIVNIPKLEEWQIKDYMCSILPGLDEKYIDWLMKNSNNNIYRLQQEADKLLIFTEKERNILFKKMLEDDAFIDITSNTIFNFTNSITNKDVRSLNTIYSEIENIDIEPIGLVTVLYKNFKDIISVQLTKNATAQSLNMNPKKFNAIRYSCGKYNAQSLNKILKTILSIDKRLKTGELPVNLIIDYLLVNILSK